MQDNDTTTLDSIPYGYCHCGCGGRTPLAKRTRPSLGHVKGRPTRYLSGHSSRGRRDQTEPMWDGQRECWVIPLTKGRVALVDASDFPIVQSASWHYSADGYASARINGVVVKMHRLLLSPPSRMVVDHINHDRLDNRRSNLRICTQSDNLRNRSAASWNNKTGYIGVCKHGEKWTAHISVANKNVYLGTFDTSEDAAKARDKATIEVSGEMALLNFPVDD